MSSSSERVGRYQLLEPIGMGPCGTVSRAKVFGVAGFERQFAIKRFHPELTITSALASQLSSAARAYGSLEHPRIARMSEFGIAQGTTFTAVELVQGLDASRLIAETKLAGGSLAAGGALALVSQAARAVGYAHGRGLSHLGLAPTNVIVTSDGDIKITDFGILAAGLPQRPVDVARLANRIQYLAPEQLANEATSAATDVFALGVIAYEMVTGHRTFNGATPAAIATAILEGPPPEPPLPRPIVRVLHRCLARSPFERFPDARALADALDAALRVAPVPGTRKDIGAQVKTTMDRLAEMRENEMSGMVALHVGTGPIARVDAPEVATLGRGEMSGTPDDPSATNQFVRPSVPVPGPTPLVSPGAPPSSGLAAGPKPNMTLMGAAPPPIPSMPPPVAKPPSTPPPTKGLPTSVPPVIPPIAPPGQRPVSSQIPKIPSSFPPPIAPQAARTEPGPPAPPPPATPRTPTPGNIPSVARTSTPGNIPSIARTGTANPPSAPAASRTTTAGSGSPPPLPRTLTPARAASPPTMAGPHEPPELQRPSEHPLEHKPAGRIEIDPPPSFDPGTSPGALSMDNLFEDTSLRAPAPDDASAPPDAPAVSRTSSRMTPHPHSDRPTSEMAQDFVEKLREEAAQDPQDGEPTIDRNLPPTNLAPFDTQPGMGVAPSRPSADDDSADQLTTPVPKTPPVEATAPAPAAPAPATSSPAASSTTQPSASATTPVRPVKKSRAGLFAFLGVVVVAGLAVGAWQVYERVIVADSGDAQVASAKPTNGPDTTTTTPATTPDAAGATTTPDAAPAPDAASETPTDAAVATSTPDAATEAPADAAVAATTPDAADASPTPTDTPAKTPSEELIITSTPSNARVYIDGSDVGTTPVKIDGTDDKHTIALLLAGHELYIAEVDGKGSYAIPLKEVTPRGGSGAGVKVIKCKAKERYYVFADGKPTGQMCPTERIITGLGPHVIEVYDAVTETKNKWDVDIKDDRLSFRIRVE